MKQAHPYSTRRQSNLHNRQLHDYLDGNHNELIRRSLLGLPKVYNSLKQEVVDAKSVKSFQRELQELVRKKAEKCEDGWEQSLNLRKVAFSV